MNALYERLPQIINELYNDRELRLVFRALWHLREGTTLEIAKQAGVNPETALEKLRRLAELGLAKALPEQEERFRHYYLSSQAYANRDVLAGVAAS
jgi:DNA-binding IclR family transcriptional regulator